MNEPSHRRSNFRLFEFISSRMSDAELRTMAECVRDEIDFRSSRRLTDTYQERDERRVAHREIVGTVIRRAPVGPA